MAAPWLQNLGMLGERKILFSAGGNIIFVGGQIVFTPPGGHPDACECCDEDGCTYSVTDCANCDAGKTPSEFVAVFSGVNLADTECVGNVGAGESATNVSCSINGSHTLTQNTSCTWVKTITSDFSYDYNAESEDCTGGSPTTITHNLRIALTRNAGDWTLEAFAITTVRVIDVYRDTVIAQAASGDCDTLGASTNDISAFDISVSPNDLGKDGSATVTCN